MSEYVANADGTLRILEAVKLLGLEKIYQASIWKSETTPFYPYAVAKM